MLTVKYLYKALTLGNSRKRVQVIDGKPTADGNECNVRKSGLKFGGAAYRDRKMIDKSEKDRRSAKINE